MNRDIRLNTSIFAHPKIKKLKKRFGPEGVICWLKLLCFVGREKTSGRLERMDAEEIAIASELEDETASADGWVSGLTDLKLLDQEGETYAIHDWLIHNEWAAGFQKRSRASRKANHVKALAGSACTDKTCIHECWKNNII